MYCVKCGVKLGDTEKKCPLCNTVVYHPEVTQKNERELYPIGKMPRSDFGRAFLCGAVIIMFMIPIILTFFSDMQFDGKLDWFGYVAGALTLIYLTFALPMWFKSPNPVIFVPCDFLAAAIYLLYIDLSTGGGWFLSFALPVTAGVGVVVCALVTLLRYLHRGRLFVVGGGAVALGALVLMVELLMCSTFGLKFIGWSIYPLISLTLIGGLLIYLAISSTAREKIESKIFF
jgi:hypothetical protein